MPLNKYAGTCRCGTYVYPGRGAFVAGKVLCDQHAPEGSMTPAAPPPLPDGMHEVEMRITGSPAGCEAALEKLRLYPLTHVMSTQRGRVEPDRAEVLARVRVYVDRWQADEDVEAQR